MTKNKMLTQSGIEFDLLNPKSEDVDLEDIIYSMINTRRFAGHANYTVADHCVNVMHIAPKGYELEALLHDAAETYIGDIIRPVKEMFPGIVNTENNIYRFIAEKFGLPTKISDVVLEADNRMLRYEMNKFFRSRYSNYVRFNGLGYAEYLTKYLVE